MNKDNENEDIHAAGSTMIDLALVARLAAKAEDPVALADLAPDAPWNTANPAILAQGKVVNLDEHLVPVERINAAITTAPSFVDALERWGRLGMTTIWVDPVADLVIAVLDDVADRAHERRRIEARRARLEAMLASGELPAVPEIKLKDGLEGKALEEAKALRDAVKEKLTEKWAEASQTPADQRLWVMDEEHRRTKPEERLVLRLQKSEEYVAWTQLNGKEVEQAAFAKFIDEHIEDIDGDGDTYPAGNVVQKVAIELEGRSGVDWEARVNPQTGARVLVWKETVGTVGNFAVPRVIRLRLRPWVGAPAQLHVVSLGYRVVNRELRFRLDFRRLDTRREEARTDLATFIADRTGYPVFVGTPTT